MHIYIYISISNPYFNFFKSRISKYFVIHLGMKQGSVSSLLNNPKPWFCLKAKGKTPYMRMKMFIEDPFQIDRLIQYVVVTQVVNSIKGKV